MRYIVLSFALSFVLCHPSDFILFFPVLHSKGTGKPTVCPSYLVLLKLALLKLALLKLALLKFIIIHLHIPFSGKNLIEHRF